MQILSRALERLRSYPVPDYAVWTSYWEINRGVDATWSTWRLAERFAERTSDGLQNVVESVPRRGAQLPDANVSSVFEGPFAWSLRSTVTVQQASGVDVETFDLWEAHFAGKYPALVPYGTSPLVPSDITVFFKRTLGYQIAYRLAWHYKFDGSYFAFRTSIIEIAFPDALPDWLFNSAAYARHEKAKEPDILYQVLQAVPTPAPSGN